MMPYSLNWLLAKHNAAERLKYLFFWGHQPERDGSVGKGCFSQWWLSAFTVDGTTYPTAEHWMMAEKARLFNDHEVLAKILVAGTPAQAKKLGRQVRGFVAETWEAHSFKIVVMGNYHKFSQHPDLATYLRQTNDRILVEASPFDPVWGIGMAQNNPNVENPLRWKGQNKLGFALMEVRDRLG
jgi:ribA/ribD-fused uncharacterized protein